MPTQISETSLPRSASRRIAGDADPAARDHLGHQFDHALFHHRRLAVADQLEFRGIDVDPGDLMSLARQAGQRYRAHVAESEDADSHEVAACEAGRMEEAR